MRAQPTREIPTNPARVMSHPEAIPRPCQGTRASALFPPDCGLNRWQGTARRWGRAQTSEPHPDGFGALVG